MSDDLRQRKLRLGDLLIQAGLLTDAQLQLALQEQKRSGSKLGRAVIDLGFVAEVRLLTALSEQMKIPFVELRHFKFDNVLVQSLPEAMARRFRAIILTREAGGLLVGMSDPLDLFALDEMERLLKTRVHPAVVREAELLATLDTVYRRTSEIASIAGELEGDLQESDFDLAKLGADNNSEAPVVRLLQTLFEEAVQMQASDIHIEPDEGLVRIRQRIDGVLSEQVMKEHRIASALVMRLKIMSGLDISEKRLPQDGRFNIRVKGRNIDVRVSTMPVQFGESVVMRLLDQSGGVFQLEGTGMPTDLLVRFRRLLQRPFGMVLVTGPTGSGKTTTLYAGLSELNSPEKKIITVEDPVEYRLPRVNQVQVNAKIAGEAVMLAGMMGGNPAIGASARAARRTTASVVVGSRLVRVEGGLSAALLDATLGYKGKLTVMDYNSLASANVDVGQFLRALNVKANINAVTFDQVLSAPVSVGQILDAMIATTPAGSVQTLLKKAAPPSTGTGKVMLDQVLDLGAISHLPINGLLAGEAFPVSVGEVLAGSAALADGDHQIAVNLASVLGDASIANASLDVGQKPQTLNYKGRAGEGTELSTSQFALNIGALGALKVDVTMANAEIEIDDIRCKADGSAEVVLKSVTEVASVGVKAPILPRIAVKLGNGEEKKLTFSNADIKAQTYKPVRSGLGLQLGSLSVAQKLLFTPVDSLLEKLGLHVAEADVKVTEATCGSAGLVH